MFKKDLSIIIVSYNTKDLLANCLNSIQKEITGIDYEIIIVDNASSDGSSDMVKSRFPNTSLIINSENVGFGRANNQGARLAEGRYILFLNSDTILLKGDYPALLRVCEDNGKIGAVGCKVLNADMTLQYSCFHFPSLIYEYLRFTFWIIKFIHNFVYNQSRMVYWAHNDARPVDCISGCFMLIRKDVIDQVGLFDEGYFMSYEDADLCLRFMQNDLKVLYYPEIRIVHFVGSSRGDIMEETKCSFQSASYYFRKNKSFNSFFLFVVSTYITWFVFFIFFSIIRLIIKSKKVHKKQILFGRLLK